MGPLQLQFQLRKCRPRKMLRFQTSFQSLPRQRQSGYLFQRLLLETSKPSCSISLLRSSLSKPISPPYPHPRQPSSLRRLRPKRDKTTPRHRWNMGAKSKSKAKTNSSAHPHSSFPPPPPAPHHLFPPPRPLPRLIMSQTCPSRASPHHTTRGRRKDSLLPSKETFLGASRKAK